MTMHFQHPIHIPIIDHPYVLSTTHTFLYYQLSTTGKIPGCKCARS